MEFLPEGYKRESSSSRYFKMEEGDNSFRITSPLIVGFEKWYKNDEGNRKVARVKVADKSDLKSLPGDENIRFFWAFTLWNTEAKAHQLAVITQVTIQESIENLVRNDKWGSPIGTTGYDLTITKKGKGKETSYTVAPNPKEKLDKEVIAEVKAQAVNIDALFDGSDPFEEVNDKEVKPDDLPF